MLLRMQEEDIQASDREKSARFRITVCRTLRFSRDSLMEAVAETSEEFMERYFNGEEFSVEEIRAAMRTEVMDGDIVPVAMGSNIQAQGRCTTCFHDIVRFLPESG